VKGRRTPISPREQELLGTIEELEVRLREVHHRVRRQLQTISSLLSLQAERSRDEGVSRALADAATRIQTIATIDDQLRDQPATAPVDMRGAIRAISELAQVMVGVAVPPVVITHHLESFSLPPDLAVQCGLVVNELVTNALQHGFRGRSGGKIDVRAHVRGGRVTLVVEDDGIGPTPEAEAGGTPGLGLDLVRLLVIRQLHGEFAMATSGGTRCRVTFPYPSATAPADPA
jgi:two-component sensor histidine kinase